jgi:hypothetical protein
MKNTSVIVALVVGVSLIISAAILSSALKDYGRSLERAATYQPRSVSIPEHFKISLESGSSPVRFDLNSKPWKEPHPGDMDLQAAATKPAYARWKITRSEHLKSLRQ